MHTLPLFLQPIPEASQYLGIISSWLHVAENTNSRVFWIPIKVFKGGWRTGGYAGIASLADRVPQMLRLPTKSNRSLNSWQDQFNARSLFLFNWQTENELSTFSYTNFQYFKLYPLRQLVYPSASGQYILFHIIVDGVEETAFWSRKLQCVTYLIVQTLLEPFRVPLWIPPELGIVLRWNLSPLSELAVAIYIYGQTRKPYPELQMIRTYGTEKFNDFAAISSVGH